MDIITGEEERVLFSHFELSPFTNLTTIDINGLGCVGSRSVRGSGNLSTVRHGFKSSGFDRRRGVRDPESICPGCHSGWCL